MSTIPSFISELVRAANEVEKLTDLERVRLVNRAVITIRELRALTGMWPSRTTVDMATDLQATAVALSLGKKSDEEVKAALLEGAAAIRVLKIMLDVKE